MATIKTATSMSNLRSAASALKKHLAKADANHDGRVSEAEVKKYAKALPGGKAMGDALVTLTSYALNAQGGGTKVTVAGVSKRVDDALASIKARDANKNGKIDTGRELTNANALKTFQALAALANARDVVAPKLNAKQLGEAVKPLTKDAFYVSETDMAPIFVSGTLPAGKGITPASVTEALKKPLGDFMKADFDITGLFKNGDLSGGVMEEINTAKQFFERTEAYDPENGPLFKKSSDAFKQINALLKQNLTDVKVFYFGPKDPQNPKRVEGSPGLCCYVVAGKTADGKVAGLIVGAVHT